MMNTMPKFSTSVIVTLLFISSALMAKPSTPDDYTLFVPTKAELAKMLNAADKACHAKAENASNPSPDIDCNDIAYERIDKRLNASYIKLMKKLSKAKKDQLSLEQNKWLTTRFDACEAKWKEELNVEGVTYRYEVSKCNLAELYRRTLWIERYR